MQREFATKSGTNTSIPPAMAKMVSDVSEEIIKAQAVQNKAVLAAIDATQQSVNTFYESAKSFTGLTQSALQNWISASSTYTKLV
jgi:TRAP-type mannitol/chloroaromatic compound transport system substrate-binding protein